MTTQIDNLPTTNSPIYIPDISYMSGEKKDKQIVMAQKPYFGTIAQASAFCRVSGDFKLPTPTDLASLFIALHNKYENPELVTFQEHISGHFLSGCHTLESKANNQHMFYAAPQPDYAGEDYTTVKDFNGKVSGLEIKSEDNPDSKLLFDAIFNKQTLFTLAFGLRNKVKFVSPQEEPNRYNMHGIVSIKSSLENIYVSAITDPHAMGIVPLVLKQKKD